MAPPPKKAPAASKASNAPNEYAQSVAQQMAESELKARAIHAKARAEGKQVSLQQVRKAVGTVNVKSLHQQIGAALKDRLKIAKQTTNALQASVNKHCGGGRKKSGPRKGMAGIPRIPKITRPRSKWPTAAHSVQFSDDSFGF